MFAEPSSAEKTKELVYEAVDSAKSDLHRTNIMRLCALICFCAWGLFWGILFSGVTNRLVIKYQTLGYVIQGIIISLALTAYVSAAAAVSLFVVSSFSLVLWQVKYKNLESSDTDYVVAKSENKRACISCVVVSIVVILPILLAVLIPRMRLIVNPFRIAF